jgi:hypothetical protein
MAVGAAIKASDADRERVAERLRTAAGEGRLLTEELEQRLEAALSARTYAQLNDVLHDLPGRRLTAPGRRTSPGLAGYLLGALVAMMLVLAVAAAIVLALTGVFAGWILWVVAGWFFFGRRRARFHGTRCGGSLHPRGGWTPGPPRGLSS